MNNDIKLLVITDSLGLPRDVPELVKYEDTWPYLLRENFLVHQVSIGGATTLDFVRQLVYHKMFNPHVVIIQAGIVDCAPRALTKFESELYNKFYITRKILSIILPKYSSKIRSLRKKTYTPISNFYSNVARIKSAFENIPIIWIGIINANQEYNKKVPGIIKNIENYNNILEKEFLNYFIPTKDLTEAALMEDHIHLTGLGNKLIYNKVIEKLSFITTGGLV